MRDCTVIVAQTGALPVVWVELSPQSTSTAQGLSFTPGSENEPRVKDFEVPSSAVWFVAAVTTGFLLAMVTPIVSVRSEARRVVKDRTPGWTPGSVRVRNW